MKPILSKIGVFDATKDHTFQFAAYADIDIVAVIVFDTPTGSILQGDTVSKGVYKFGTFPAGGSGLARYFTIPAGTFENRKDPYYMIIRCRLTGTNLFSEYTDKVLFYCHEQPTIKLGDLTNIAATTIPYPSYSFDFSYKYNASQGEVVNRYEFYLYDNNHELLKKSECFYYRDSLKSFQVDGLDNHTTYYVRAKAESIGGYQLDTGFLPFKTDYPESIDDTTFFAQNQYRTASIFMHVQYYLTRSSGANALRIKRRKKGASTWTTIYQNLIDMNHVIMKMGWANIHINRTTGQPTSSYSSVTSDYIDKSRVLSFKFTSKDKKFNLIAYDENKKFIKASSTFESTSEFNSSDEYNEWFSDAFLNKLKYYRVEVTSKDDKDMDVSAFNDFYMYSADDGWVLMDYIDYYAIGRNSQYEYAVAPVANGIELGYVKTEVISDFDGAIITDGDKVYHILLEPKVESTEKVRSTSVIETMGNKYPYLFSGSEANYYTGHFSGVGIRFDNNMEDFDINGGNEFRDELSAWLTNSKAKLLKMWDGRRWLIGVNGNVSLSCSEHYDKGVLEFDFVELGDVEDERDMYNNGLSEYQPGGGV